VVVRFAKIKIERIEHNVKFMMEIVILMSKLASLTKPDFFSRNYTPNFVSA